MREEEEIDVWEAEEEVNVGEDTVGEDGVERLVSDATDRARSWRGKHRESGVSGFRMTQEFDWEM